MAADDTFASPPPFIFPADVIVPPHQMCVCLTFCPLFLPPRGAGGGDGKSRDGRPPRETEAPTPTQRALPVPPAGVFTCHAHQVNGCRSILFYFLEVYHNLWSQAVNKASIQLIWAIINSKNEFDNCTGNDNSFKTSSVILHHCQNFCTQSRYPRLGTVRY